MKLRIRGDSIRLRLTRSEVDRMGSEGACEERTRVGPTPLVYRLEAAEVDAPEASFDGGRLTVRLPQAQVQDWVATERVGIDAHQPIEGGRLRILVEKDFQCLAPREDEDQSDAFAHPNAGSQSC